MKATRYGGMNGIRVKKHKDGTMFVPLPLEVQRPVTGGCQCSYCKDHPDKTPMWDTLALHPEQDVTWTVHYP